MDWTEPLYARVAVREGQMVYAMPGDEVDGQQIVTAGVVQVAYSSGPSLDRWENEGGRPADAPEPADVKREHGVGFYALSEDFLERPRFLRLVEPIPPEREPS